MANAHRELVKNGFGESEVCLMAPGNVAASYLGVGPHPFPKDSNIAPEEAQSLRDLMGRLRPSGTFCVAGPVHVSDGVICAYMAQDSQDAEKSGWFSNVLSAWIARRSAQYLEDRLGEGKILIWVQTGHRTESRREHLACDILLRHASESVRVLDFAPIQ